MVQTTRLEDLRRKGAARADEVETPKRYRHPTLKSDLIEVALINEVPRWAEKRQDVGVVRYGRSHENGVRRAVKRWVAAQESVEHYPSQWIRYTAKANNCPLYAQPDDFLVFGDRVVVIEAKRTLCARGWMQLFGLYRPLLTELWPDKAFVGVQAIRYWAPVVPYDEIASDLEAVVSSTADSRVVWEYGK